jgi:hypothetical protein
VSARERLAASAARERRGAQEGLGEGEPAGERLGEDSAAELLLLLQERNRTWSWLVEHLNKNPGANWFYQLRHDAEGKKSDLGKELGVPDTDEASAPLLTPDFLALSEYLDKTGTGAAFYTKWGITIQRTLCGRASDVKKLAWEEIRRDLAAVLQRFGARITVPPE